MGSWVGCCEKVRVGYQQSTTTFENVSSNWHLIPAQQQKTRNKRENNCANNLNYPTAKHMTNVIFGYDYYHCESKNPESA